jgi:hypothetical protein
MYQLTEKEQSLVDQLAHDGRMDTWAIVHAVGKTAYDTSPWHKGIFHGKKAIIMEICALELLCLSNRGKSLYEMSDSELIDFRNDLLSMIASLPSEEDFKDAKCHRDKCRKDAEN